MFYYIASFLRQHTKSKLMKFRNRESLNTVRPWMQQILMRSNMATEIVIGISQLALALNKDRKIKYGEKVDATLKYTMKKVCL